MLEMTGKKPMNRTYTANSPYSLSPTERIRSYPEEPGYEAGYSNQDGYQNGYRGHEPGAYETQPEYPGLQEPEDFDEYLQKYEEQKTDRRWMWVAGIAGVILFIAIGTTGIVLGGGDSGEVSATGDTEPTTSAPATTSARPSAAAPAPGAPSLPPETVTTVTPSAEAPTEPAPPAVESAPPAPVAAAPEPPAADPRTITYRVTGARPLVDLVTIVYTDGRGALQTDVNVALPWSKTVVLEPGVELKSVTATSVASALNCSITDAAGNEIVAQNNNAIIATCTR